MTYKQWLRKVDAEVARITGGYGMDHFGDSIYLRDRHSDECTPKETALEILENDTMGRGILEVLGEEE